MGNGKTYLCFLQVVSSEQTWGVSWEDLHVVDYYFVGMMVTAIIS